MALRCSRSALTVLSAKLFLQAQSKTEVTEMKSRIRLVSSFIALAMLLPALVKAEGTVPVGAKITVVTDQSVSSKTAKAGETVTGSVAHDVISEGKVVIPKGSPVKLTVSSVQASGRLSTPAKLYLRLRTVTVGGKTYPFATNSAGRTLGGKRVRLAAHRHRAKPQIQFCRCGQPSRSL